MHLGYDNPHHASYFMDGIEERDLGVIMSEDVKWENSVLQSNKIPANPVVAPMAAGTRVTSSASSIAIMHILC